MDATTETNQRICLRCKVSKSLNERKLKMKTFSLVLYLLTIFLVGCANKTSLSSSVPQCSGNVSGSTTIGCGETLPCNVSGTLVITCSSYTNLSAIQDLSGTLITCVAPTQLPLNYSGTRIVDSSICKP